MAWKTLKNEVEFLAQYSMVGQAIADNASPIPGYLYGEINALTYVDNGSKCKPLINFLASQLQADSPQVSMKVLKLLLYLVKNGHAEVVEDVRLQEIALKKAMGFHGPPDVLHGNIFYENIRKMSKELLEYVFTDHLAPASSNLASENQQRSGVTEMDGYGSSASGKKLTGFGFTVKTSKSVSEKVTDGLTSFVEKLMPSNTKENQVNAEASILGESLPQYKPITIDKGPQDVSENPLSEKSSQLPLHLEKIKRKTKVHKAGRPGGGWNDSDDEPEYILDLAYGDPSKGSTISVDSLESSLKLDLQSVPEWIDEHQVVDEFAVNEPLEKMQYESIHLLCKRCSSLNCDKVLAFLISKLSEKEDNVKLRALVFIEYLLFNDIVTLESLVKIVLPPLQIEKEASKSAVQTKSKKICLIIQNLINYQKVHLSTPKSFPGIPLKSAS